MKNKRRILIGITASILMVLAMGLAFYNRCEIRQYKIKQSYDSNRNHYTVVLRDGEEIERFRIPREYATREEIKANKRYAEEWIESIEKPINSVGRCDGCSQLTEFYDEKTIIVISTIHK